MTNMLHWLSLVRNLRWRLPITYRRLPQQGQGICSMLLTKNTKFRIFNKVIICYNDHTIITGDAPSATVAAVAHQTGASFPFFYDMVIISVNFWSGNPVSFWAFYFGFNSMRWINHFVSSDLYYKYFLHLFYQTTFSLSYSYLGIAIYYYSQ